MLEKLLFVANPEPAKFEQNFALFSGIAEVAASFVAGVADRGGRVCRRRAGRTGEILPGFQRENLRRESRSRYGNSFIV